MMKKIGGEFDINPELLSSAEYRYDSILDSYCYSSGRAALYAILLDVKEKKGITKILLPDYLCTSIIEAVSHAGLSYEFYEINDNLELEPDDFMRKYEAGYAVLLINYFGLISLSHLIDFIRNLDNSALIIEDDVQSYFCYADASFSSDYKFTSLRKTFPAPDGGLVKSKSKMEEPVSASRFYQYKLAAGILKYFNRKEYYEDSIFLKILEEGEKLITSEINSGMSGVSKKIFSSINFADVAKARKDNAKFICAGLSDLGMKPLLPITESSVPLFVPIYLNDRDKVRSRLFENNIFCPNHWPLDGLQLKKGKEMQQHELSIVIDQRYDMSDMVRLLEIIDKAIR